MMISIIIGVIHVCLGAGMDAIRYGRSKAALPSYGWVLLVSGGFVIGIGASVSLEILKILGGSLMVVGAFFVMFFSGLGQKPLNRLGTGLLAIAGITGAFGDVLSYLRLFALGVASASLAVAFNDMAAQIYETMPGSGLFFAILVLILGHTLNLFLGISSGVIHGMRLNVIEFFNWALKEEGKIFQPFQRKEGF
jgi:V/A-type H+-transporting ATPase subunit I